MKNNILNKKAILYSKEQQCWHIEDLEDYITSNLRFLHNKTSVQQYRLVWLVDTLEQANDFTNEHYNDFKLK